jgi:hypothetical protein
VRNTSRRVPRSRCCFKESHEKWWNVVGLRHLPEGTHSLAPRPGSLVRLTFRESRPRLPPRNRIANEDEDDDEKDLEMVRVAGVAPALSKV